MSKTWQDLPPTPTVKAISEMSFTGNIIPRAWYEHVVKSNGKPDLLAITLLSDIIYWYHWTIIKDEETNQPLGVMRKFDADKLQYSYRQMARSFGVSKRQAASACKRLNAASLLTMEFRTIRIGDVTLNNVLFLEPVPTKIAAISFRKESRDVASNKSSGDNEYVYFILSPLARKVKIGYSKNPERRLRDIQGYSPEQLVLLKRIRGDMDKEKELHDKFKYLRIRGEWFEYTSELEGFIDSLNTLSL